MFNRKIPVVHRASILLANILLAGICHAAAQSPSGSTARPNVILLLTDDQGYGDLSCHGNPVLKTPNIDRLSAQSVRFTNFHVSPMCTPTRAQLLTGVDALRSAAMNVSSGRALLRTDLPTLGDIFAANGYRTAMFGKWHLGDSYPYRPIDRGFQKAVWFRSSYIGSASDYWNNDYFNDHYFDGDQLRQFEGYCTDVFFNQALAWLQERQRGGEPFFLYLPLNAAHAPLFVPERYRREYERLLAEKNLPPKQRDSLARFFGMVANIDENLGKLDALLDETGLRENTIFIFMTDNGGTAGVPFYNAGMRGNKTTLWEGGHRVPCFVRWPAGNIGRAREVNALTQCQDVLPTLIDLCKLTPPQTARFDGVSLADLLTGKAEELPDRALVVQFSRMNSPRPQKNDAAILWRQWRLLKGDELFDLSSDPHQDKNVFAQNPDVAARLQKHYDAFWASVEPALDRFQPSVVGSEEENPARLCACDWADVFLDQGGQVRRGEPKNGLWQIEVRRAGNYEIALCRWPREAKLTLGQSSPLHRGEDASYPAGVALPIAEARLRVGDQDLKHPVAPDDREARFTMRLPQGRTTLQTYFYDSTGNELCGAYYVYVRHLAESEVEN
ncbi:MAG: arylsulfatase [Pirellulales bacterium]|nr:arylsulfatase [Pirellulales bacterium]